MFESLEQTENTIHPLCSSVLEKRNEIFNENTTSINTVYETLRSSFVDNHEDLGKLLVDNDEEDLGDIIRKNLDEVPNSIEVAIFDVIKH